jgi:O-antigen/teichoic acid export membrane protein
MIKKKLIFLDQIVVSGSNFLLVVLLLKFTNLNFLGYFSITFIFIIFANSFQNALILAPNFILIEKLITDKKKIHISNLFYIELFYIILVIIFALIYNFFIEKNFPQAESLNLNIYIIFIILYLLQNFLKRVYYSINKEVVPLLSDILIYLIFFSILLIFDDNIKNINYLYKLYLFVYLIGNFFYLKFFLKNILLPKKIFNTVKNGYRFGLYNLGSQICFVLMTNIWIINLGLIAGTASVGIARAMSNITGIFTVFYQYFENIYPKYFSTQSSKANLDKLNFAVKNFMYRYLFYFILIFFIMLFMSDYILAVFYDKKLSNYDLFFKFWLIVPLIQFIEYPFNFGLRIINKTKYIFYSYILSLIFTIFFSKTLLIKINFWGYIYGTILSISIIVIVQLIYFRKFNEFKF